LFFYVIIFSKCNPLFAEKNRSFTRANRKILKMLKFIRERFRPFGDNVLIALCFALLIILSVTSAKAQDAEYCITWADEQGWDVTFDVAISGDPLVMSKDFVAPHSTIEVRFDNEEVMVWNPTTTTRLGALADWIWTAEHFAVETETPAFAGRDANGRVWLVSKTAEVGVPNTIPCFAHPLDPL
jgi:hypothetical protein